MIAAHSNKKKAIKYFLCVILIIVIIILVTVDITRYFRIINMPDEVVITNINDPRIDGELKLYNDIYSGNYWLFLNNNNKDKLIMYVGGVRGHVTINVINDNLLEVNYIYLEEINYSRENTKYNINLNEEETKNIPLIYKLLN